MAGMGDDAVNATTEYMHKLLQIFIELLKLINSREQHKSVNLNDKQEKVKFGEMNFSEYKKMLESGEKMNTIPVPASKIDDIKKLSEVMGGRYWVLETGGNNAMLSVPEKYMTQLENVLTVLNQRQLAADPGSLAVKNGNELIPKDDMALVRNVLNYHDIPAFSFQKNDSYMNIVPKEFEGQYKAAMETVQKLKSEFKNIEITSFEQTQPFEQIRSERENILKVTEEQANYLAKALPDKALKFMKDENGATVVKFDKDTENAVKNSLENLAEEIKKAEEYAITVVDSHITVNKAKLLEKENEAEYFTKVPNTSGEDYIKIDKSEAQLLDGGKTISTKLDFDRTYRIFDKNGHFKSEKTGRELAEKYNTKSRNSNKDTKESHYNNDSLERVELYNAKENKLISIGIESAETIRRNLAEQGLTGYAAEKLLNDIDRAFPEEYREKFRLPKEEVQINYEKIAPEVIKQYEIAEKVKELTCAYKNDSENVLGQKVCIMDRNTDQYILVSAKESDLREALEKMGYDKLHINAVISEVQKSHSKEGPVLERESLEAHNFETNNAEAQQYSYAMNNEGITIIKGSISGEDAGFKYLQIEKNADRGEIEQALKKGFGMQDASACASIMKSLEDKEILDPAKAFVTRDGYEITPVTSDYVNISRNGQSIMVDKNNVTSSELVQKFGMDEKQAEKLSKSVANAAHGKSGVFGSITEIKAAAKELQQKLSSGKTPTEKESPVQSAERGI